ncbi:outer membrane protein [Parapedomonas caeni]|jgi:outer membrane immunogenic protein
MKTVAILTATALAGLPALAHAEMFNGAYGGVELGWEDTRGVLDQGINYGIVGGYNAKLGTSIVVGAEGKLGFSTADETFAVGEGTSKLSAGRSLGVAARAGYLAAPNALFYTKVGYENVRTKLDGDGFNTDAVVLGGGVEYGLTQNIGVKVGYDYTDGENGYRRHQVKTGLNFHF